ncbi:methyl-accepting chemotaxis protein [Gracilibacillus alcaliphilus]|uniref:methyl-accepting chemotaxis protein n=1 Tax=Gracilibacillus alcaliphilus TaxID=1401441 RepID=UPI00195E3FD3|nr:HAMP domain-containing methyl-accepting chemotaxis protein [Gracilibacillus alcaliphilus]MBM7678511.1 methyl-accepting chemotaxis protein [Gracilibacillus alcaliphilus]
MRQFIRNRKLSTKLYIVLSIAILVILASSFLFITTILTGSKELRQELYDHLYQSTYYLLNADRDLYQADQAIFTGFFADAGGAFQENIEQVEQRMQAAEEILIYSQNLDEAMVEESFANFYQAFNQWKSAAGSFSATIDDQNVGEMLIDMREQFETARNEIDFLQQEMENETVVIINRLEADTNNIIWTTAITVIVFILLLIILGAILIKQITKPLHQLVAVNQQVASGDLDVSITGTERQDEIGKLAKSTNQMVEELKAMVGGVQSIAHQVNQQSEDLSLAAEQVSQGSQQIAITMDEMAHGAEQQAEASSDISTTMESLHRQIALSATEGQALQQSSLEIIKLSEESESQLHQSVQQMQDITAVMQTTVSKVQSLEQQSNKISTLIDVIQQIADQTNLLALNAAIESARAGEAGKGFAVVADEVRKLAEQVSESVAEITSIIGGVQSETKEVAVVLEGGYATVELGNQRVHASEESFQTIQTQMEEMMIRINTISDNLQQVQTDSERVTEAGADIASTSEEVAAGIEESAATAQQQSSSMEEMAGNAESLANLSQNLNQLIVKFKL